MKNITCICVFIFLVAIHTYSFSGVKTVTITGMINSFSFGQNPISRDFIVDVTQWRDVLLRNSGGYFSSCINLISFSTADIPILKEVTNMDETFWSARSFNGNIANWNTSNVVDIARMFFLTVRFNTDISAWNVSNVTDMGFMFSQAIFLTKIYLPGQQIM